VLLHKELDPDDQEMTRTRKVRRRYIARNTRIYSQPSTMSCPEVKVKTVISYQDGRQAEIRIHPAYPGGGGGGHGQRVTHLHVMDATCFEARFSGDCMEFFLELLVNGLLVG